MWNCNAMGLMEKPEFLKDYVEDADFKECVAVSKTDGHSLRKGELCTAVRRYVRDGWEPVLKLKNKDWESIFVQEKHLTLKRD
jgi:hypothetical protein